ncbi:MAG: hypothetical protein K0U68_00920 [Gammaproteobacteria bacterium]|nr:hypothetical protein [Gammaproteobacteria bacterium]
MGYYIYAWLDNGSPRLKVVNALSNTECINWTYQAESNSDKKEIQRLFKELLLLTCQQDLQQCRVFKLVNDDDQ